MGPTKSSNMDFYNQWKAEGWFAAPEGDFNAFKKLIEHSKDLNSYVTSHIQAIYPQIQEKIGNGA